MRAAVLCGLVCGAFIYIAISNVFAMPRLLQAAVPAAAIALLLFLEVRRALAASDRAYDEAAQAEERFRVLVTATGSVVWRAEADGAPIISMPGPTEFTGLPAERFRRAHGWSEAFHPDDRDRVTALWQEAVATGRPYEATYRLRRQDGTWRDVVARAVPLRNADGTVREWVGIDVDVTEQKLASEAMRLQAHMLENTGDAVIATDAAGHVIYLNRAAEQLYGWSAAEARGRDIAEINVPESSREHAHEILRSLVSGGRWTGEFVVCDRSGREFTAQISTACMRNEAGEVIAIVGVSRDVSGRKAAEAALRDSELRFRQLAENIEEVFWIWTNTPRRLLYVSPAYETIWGRSCASLYAEPTSWREGVHPEDRAAAFATLANCDPEKTLDITYRVCRPDGTLRWIRDRVFPVRDENGNVVRFAGIAQDITAQVEAETALREREAQLRALASRLAAVREEEAVRISRELHDELGQALTALTFDVAEGQRELSALGANGEGAALEARLARVHNRLHDTIETTRRICTELRPAILDQLGLAAAIEWQTEEFEARTGILCDRKLPPAESHVESRVAMVTFRIFQELLTNVARHSQATAAQVELVLTADEIRLVVQDNGIGITKASDVRSSGLGILGMRERAEAIGGTISINIANGHGTRAVVTLPLNVRVR